MSSHPALPSYDELPCLSDIGANHSWGVFGPEDELGALNLLDPDAVRAATSLVRSGERIGLSQPLDQPDPAWSRPRSQSGIRSTVIYDDWP